MGIRKHFEQQKEDDKDLKMSDMSLDTEKSDKTVFDPEKELTEQEWDIILKFIEENQDSPSFVCNLAAKLKLLSEKRLGQLQIDMSEMEEKFHKHFDNIRKSGAGFDLAIQAANYKTLFPEKFAELDITDEEWEVIKDFTGARHMNPFSYANHAAKAAISFPQRLPKLSYNASMKQESSDIVKKLENKGEKNQVSLAANMKIFFGNMEFTGNMWQNARRLFENMKRKVKSSNNFVDRQRISSFIDLMVKLKILAAKEVKVTDQGLVLVMSQQDFKQHKQKRPERKTF